MQTKREGKPSAGPDLDAALIFGRVGEVIGATKAVEIAAALGTGAARFGMWKNRNTIPLEQLCAFAGQHSVTLDWLLLGHGQPRGAVQGLDIDLLAKILELLTTNQVDLLGSVDLDYLAKTASSVYAKVHQEPGLNTREQVLMDQVSHHAAALSAAQGALAEPDKLRRRLARLAIKEKPTR